VSRRRSPRAAERVTPTRDDSEVHAPSDVDELVRLYEDEWSRATLDSIALEGIPRAMSDSTWAETRELFRALLWTSNHDGVPVLLAYLTDTFRLQGREQRLHVLLSIYDDGQVESHYFSSLERDLEVATRPRKLARVVGGEYSGPAPMLIVDEPSFGLQLTLTQVGGTEALNVVRVLARREGAYANAQGQNFEQTDRGVTPKPRLVRDAREAEELAAEWLQSMGFVDARTTPPGADGGIDLHTPSTGQVVGQVKFEAVKTGRPRLQALYGAGHAAGASVFVFFSSAGYTAAAAAWADVVGMALFRFRVDGAVEAANESGRRLLGV
jgi:hypothetical protein